MDVNDPVDLALYMMKRKFSGNNVSIANDKEHDSFLQMLRDMSPLPDPEFKEGDVQPMVEDAGAALDKIEAHDSEFKKMINDMFEDTKGFQKITEDELYTRMISRGDQNGLSDSKLSEGNGGSTKCVASGEQTTHTSSKETQTLHTYVQETTASVVIPTIEAVVSCT